MGDDWIREEARRQREEEEARRAQAARSERERAEAAGFFRRTLPPLWSAFGESLRAKSEAYNKEYGRQVFHVEVHPDTVSATGERAGCRVRVDVTVNLDTALITSHLSTQHSAGGQIESAVADMPHVRATDGREGLEWANENGAVSPEQVADVVMRSLVSGL